MSIVLYGTGCPRCNVLTKKLNSKNIEFTEIQDVALMVSKGIDAVPVLEVDGEIMDFKRATDWVNAQGD